MFWAIELVRDRQTREMLVPYNASGPDAAPMTELLTACRERGLMPIANYNRLHVVPPCNISAHDARTSDSRCSTTRRASSTTITVDAVTALALEVQGVTGSFPGGTALDDVSLVVHNGEVHALVGENGAGKSTLIKIVSGALAADAGQSASADGRCRGPLLGPPSNSASV